MTDKKTIKTDKDSEPLTRSALRLLSNIPAIISALVSLIAIAYVTGWIQAKAYFSKFSAAWLTSELSPFHLLQFSWLPLLYLTLFIWLGIQDLEATENDKQLRRWLATAKVLKYGLIPILIIISLSDYLSSRYENIAIGLIVCSIFACVFYAGAAFEGLVILARKKCLVWDTCDLKLVVAIIMFGLYFAPKQLGLLKGVIDSSPERSHLPVVETIKPSVKGLRLLLISDDKFYTYQISANPSESNKIRLFNISQVKAFTNPKMKKDKNE